MLYYTDFDTLGFPFILFQIFSSFLGNVFSGPSNIYKSVCLFSKYLKIFHIFSCLWPTTSIWSENILNMFQSFQTYWNLFYGPDYLSQWNFHECLRTMCILLLLSVVSINVYQVKLFKSCIYLIDFYFATLINKILLSLVLDLSVFPFGLLSYLKFCIIWSFLI